MIGNLMNSKKWLDEEVNEKLFEFVKIAVNEYYKQDSTYDPKALLEIMNVVSAGIATLNELMGRLEREYAKFYNQHRPDCKSDKQVQSLWDSTEKGQEQLDYKYRLKSYQVVVSAVKKTLTELEIEARYSR